MLVVMKWFQGLPFHLGLWLSNAKCESQIKSRTNLETEEMVGELVCHQVAQGKLTKLSHCSHYMFMQWADVWHELWLYIPVSTSL